MNSFSYIGRFFSAANDPPSSMTSKCSQLVSKNDAWHVIYQTRQHETTVISKVSYKSFKAA